MSYVRVKAARKKTIGAKQTAKAIEKGLARVVFVADDAEEHVTRPILALCQEKGIPLVHVDSMLALGKACGIEVGAATVAITEE